MNSTEVFFAASFFAVQIYFLCLFPSALKLQLFHIAPSAVEILFRFFSDSNFFRSLQKSLLCCLFVVLIAFKVTHRPMGPNRVQIIIKIGNKTKQVLLQLQFHLQMKPFIHPSSFYCSNHWTFIANVVNTHEET